MRGGGERHSPPQPAPRGHPPNVWERGETVVHPSGVVETLPPRVDGGEAGEDLPAVSRRTVKPLPGWERRLPMVYVVVFVFAVVGLAFYPEVATAYDVTLALTVLLTVVLAVSWNVLSGFTGYVSFGHAGFFGIGSYVGALLLFYEKVDWVPAVVLAGLATSGIALAIGYPTLRLRGPYFAITMLGLSELARIVVTAWDSLTRGGLGVFLPIVRDTTPNYHAMLVLAGVAVVLSYFVGSSGYGLKLRSIRDDEGAAAAMGIDTTRYKLSAFVLSSFFPGAAGAIYARHVGYVDPATVFATIWSIRAIATAILGGQGTILGPIVGAVALTLVSEEVWARDPNLYQVVFGGIVVLVVLFVPGGLMELLFRWGVLPRSRRL
jgi:branched-chain amino acid transport system permease protein